MDDQQPDSSSLTSSVETMPSPKALRSHNLHQHRHSQLSLRRRSSASDRDSSEESYRGKNLTNDGDDNYHDSGIFHEETKNDGVTVGAPATASNAATNASIDAISCFAKCSSSLGNGSLEINESSSLRFFIADSMCEF